MKTKINLREKRTTPRRVAFPLKTFFLLLAGLTLFAAASFAQVSVTASAGTTGPTSYTTLKGAFDAINAGTHQGAITIDITGDTTEASGSVGAALNGSGSGAASYTSVLVRPSGGARTITGNIVGAVIKLNGADNVTIDGRIDGTGRNLTILNSNGSAATAGIWLASVAPGNGASNNVIRNLEIACGADQQAAAFASFGIIQTGTAINVTSTTGNDNDNNSFIANRIIRVRYGIVSRGVAGNNNIAPVIKENIIGPAAFGPDQIGRAGIYMTGDTGAIISGNIIQNVGVLFADGAAGADRFGIAIGAENWDAADGIVFEGGDYTVTKNVIHDVVDEKTFSAVGIRLGTTRNGAATNNLVANNFIYNIRSNGGPGDQVCGIAYANGHTDKIVFNSISITGDMHPSGATAAQNYGNAIRISQANSANNANLTLTDNSIYLDVTSELGVGFYAITANSAAYSFGTGGLNYNNYFPTFATNPAMRTGGLASGTSHFATDEFDTLADWKTAFTAPQDANSIQADPKYVSNTSDLHIPNTSPNVNVGLTIAGVTDDIDGLARPNGAAPDIGADEFYPPPSPTVTFNLPTGDGNNQTILEDNSLSNDNVSQIRSQNGTFVTMPFVNPATSLTINYGGDGESVTLAQLDPAFNSAEAIVLNGGAGDDRLLVDFASGNNVIPFNDINFEGGAGADGIVLLPGFHAPFVFYTLKMNAQDGIINVFGGGVIFSGQESSVGISDQLTADNRDFTFDVNDNHVILDTGFAGNDGFSRIRTNPDTSLQTDFRNPTSKLQVNLGNGNDSITVQGFDAVGAPPNATFSGQNGDDTFNITASTTTAYTVSGGLNGQTATGDTLNYDAQGGAVTRDPPTGKNGTLTAPGFQTLTFLDIENVNIIPGTVPTPTPTATPSPGVTPTPSPSPGVTPTPTPGLVGNVSTRLPVGTGDNVLIEGFIVQGPVGSTKKIMVRAIGLSLLPFGIPDALANPTLEIRDANSTLIATNDDWKVTQVGGIITGDQFAEINGSGLAPGNDFESAIIADLAPGSYTAIVRGVGNTIGTGVVDAFDISAGSVARLANIATRGLVQPGDKLMIAGFIIQNGDVRAVVLAIGPSLSAFGITNALPDTTLQVKDQNGATVIENDNWDSDPQQKQELENIGLQPSHPLEAAVIVTLTPGQYTAQVRGNPETTGIGVVQVFFLQ